jgi:hypothetical protein
MNLLLPGLLWLMTRKKGKGATPRRSHAHAPSKTKAKAPEWPSTKHPPPQKAPERSAQKTQRPADHTPAHNAPVHHEAVDPVHSAPVHHAAVHPASSAIHDAQSELLSQLHSAPPEPAPAGSSVQDHAQGGEYDIAELQAILRKLGWRGRLTTSGPIQPALTDGLWGPATHDNWVQSANKRKLDPTIVRITGQTAHVHPSTYAALKRVATAAGVVGVRSRLFAP